MKQLKRSLSRAAFFPLLVAGSAHAASITWSNGPSFGGANGHEGILTNGVLVEAVNLMAADSGSHTVDPGGLDITFVNINSLDFNSSFGGAGGGGNTDSGWVLVLSSFEWNIGSDVSAASFLSGLTVGHTYQLQLFSARSDGCCGRTHWFGDGEGNLSDAIADNAYQSIVGTFTASADMQTVEFFDSTHNPYLNAYVLRDVSAVPEPAVWLLMLGGLGIVAARRRG